MSSLSSARKHTKWYNFGSGIDFLGPGIIILKSGSKLCDVGMILIYPEMVTMVSGLTYTFFPTLVFSQVLNIILPT